MSEEPLIPPVSEPAPVSGEPAKVELAKGAPIKVKINGILTPATYYGWSEKYNMPLVLCEGKVIPRRVFPRDATDVLTVEAPAVARPDTPFPLTMGTRVELRRDGHYDIFNCIGEKLRELVPQGLGSAHEAPEAESVRAHVED